MSHYVPVYDTNGRHVGDYPVIVEQRDTYTVRYRFDPALSGLPPATYVIGDLYEIVDEPTSEARMTDEQPTFSVFRNDDGSVHVRTDRAGERAVSTELTDPAHAIQQIADAAGLKVYVGTDATEAFKAATDAANEPDVTTNP